MVDVVTYLLTISNTVVAIYSYTACFNIKKSLHFRHRVYVFLTISIHIINQLVFVMVALYVFYEVGSAFLAARSKA
jgi:hypothetical protein